MAKVWACKEFGSPNNIGLSCFLVGVDPFANSFSFCGSLGSPSCCSPLVPLVSQGFDDAGASAAEIEGPREVFPKAPGRPDHTASALSIPGRRLSKSTNFPSGG